MNATKQINFYVHNALDELAAYKIAHWEFLEMEGAERYEISSYEAKSTDGEIFTGDWLVCINYKKKENDRGS